MEALVERMARVEEARARSKAKPKSEIKLTLTGLSRSHTVESLTFLNGVMIEYARNDPPMAIERQKPTKEWVEAVAPEVEA